MPAAKLDILDQGRELADEIEIPRGASLVSRQTAAAAIPSRTEPTQPAEGPKARTVARRAQAHVLDEHSESVEVPVPLNVRVAPWVYEGLNELIYQQKAKGKKIKKERVVEAAIISYLGLVKPD